MQSKIKFDVDEQGSPIITAEIKSSDDLRDKIAKRFFENKPVKTFLVAQRLPDNQNGAQYQLNFISDYETAAALFNKLTLHVVDKQTNEKLKTAFNTIFDFIDEKNPKQYEDETPGRIFD